MEDESSWLLVVKEDGIDATVKELTKFMVVRCFTCKNRSQTDGGYFTLYQLFPHNVWRIESAYFTFHSSSGCEMVRKSARKSEVAPQGREASYMGTD